MGITPKSLGQSLEGRKWGCGRAEPLKWDAWKRHWDGSPWLSPGLHREMPSKLRKPPSGCLRRLDDKGSDLINGFIHRWIQNLNRLLGGGGRSERGSLVGGSKLLGCVLKSFSGPSPFLVPWAEQLCSTRLSPTMTDWNLWNHELKQTLLPVSCLHQDFCHSDKKTG
jgi:hypothetical protein